jgi:hypothetical protein
MFIYLNNCGDSDGNDQPGRDTRMLSLYVGLGGISSKSDPLAFRTAIGWHYCDDRFLLRLRSPFENRISLSFDAVHCHLFLNHSTTHQWKSLATDDSFLRFSIGAFVKRVPFLDPSTIAAHVFTDFLVTVSESDPFEFLVQPEQSSLIQNGSEYAIRFRLSQGRFDPPESDPDYSTFVILFVAVIVAGSDWALLSGYRQKFPKLSVLQIADFWKISGNVYIANGIAGIGVHFMVLFTGYSVAMFFSERYTVAFVAASLVGQLCGSAVVGVVCGVFGLAPKLSAFLAPLVFGPWQIATLWAGNVRDAFVGLSLSQVAVFEGVWCIGLAVASRIGVRVAQRFGRRPPGASPRRLELRNPLSIADLGWVLGEYVILRFAIDHLFQAVLDDFQYDSLFLGAIAAVTGAVIALHAIRRTVKLLAVNSERWQEGHISGAALVAALCMAQGCATCTDCGSSSRGICFGYALLFAGVVFAVCSAFSYYTAVFFVHRLTAKEANDPVATVHSLSKEGAPL